MKTINIGIFAHVDAGKTTITENILFESGAIGKLGRVDRGNTRTDRMDVERRRGISVEATPTSVNWKGVKINIIDTPGHGDFIAEVERSMIPLDGAVLVLSAKEGIQPYTVLLFNTLTKLGIPTILFINKIDRPGAHAMEVVADMQHRFSGCILPIEKILDHGGEAKAVSSLFCYNREEAVDRISLGNQDFMERYLQDQSFSKEELDNEIRGASSAGLIYPVLFGSALNSVGIKQLMDSMVLLLPVNEADPSLELSGVVFKVGRETGFPRLTFVRLYQGSLFLRQNLGSDKVTSVWKLEQGNFLPAKVLEAGDIGVVTGLTSLNIGDCFGPLTRSHGIELGKPTLKVRVVPRKAPELSILVNGIKEMADGDPLLGYELDEVNGELYINLFGNVQKEIVKEILDTRYKVDVEFKEEILIYRETVKQTGEGLIKMGTAQNPYVATVGLKVEPTEPGGGVHFRSLVSPEKLPQKFQKAIEDGVFNTLKQGLFGWELDDMEITLTRGKFDFGSTPADFRDLTPMVFMEAVDRAKTKLLWPLNRFELTVPQGLMGRSLGDLSKMEAVFSEPDIQGENCRITGIIPGELSRNYDLQVISYTGGTGSFAVKFHSYGDAPAHIRKARKKIYVDPLDRGKYLLSKKQKGS